MVNKSNNWRCSNSVRLWRGDFWV